MKTSKKKVYGFLYQDKEKFALLDTHQIKDWEDGTNTFRFLVVPLLTYQYPWYPMSKDGIGLRMLDSGDGWVYPHPRLATFTAPFRIEWEPGSEIICEDISEDVEEEEVLQEKEVDLQEPLAIREAFELEKISFWPDSDRDVLLTLKNGEKRRGWFDREKAQYSVYKEYRDPDPFERIVIPHNEVMAWEEMEA